MRFNFFFSFFISLFSLLIFSFTQSELNDCTLCEDQYLKTLENRGAYRGNTTSNTTSSSTSTSTSSTSHTTSLSGSGEDTAWVCQRCITATNQPINTGLQGLPKSVVKPCFYRDNFSGNVYYPVPDFCTGWCQAKRRNRSALKNVYLSPLGYELNSKEEAIEHQEFEKTVHANLLLSRENEYKEYRCSTYIYFCNMHCFIHF